MFAVGVCHGDDARAQAGVRCEDAMVAVAVDARRRDEASERGEEVERREDEQGAAVGCGARRPVEDLSYAPGVGNGVVAAMARKSRSTQRGTPSPCGSSSAARARKVSRWCCTIG